MSRPYPIDGYLDSSANSLSPSSSTSSFSPPNRAFTAPAAAPVPLPYTASDLCLDDHPSTRSPAYYASPPLVPPPAHTRPPPPPRPSPSLPPRRPRRRGRRAARRAAAAQVAMRAEADMTCGLVGPVAPFWGASTLRAMGSSRVLPLGAYIAWRLLLAGLAGLGLGMVLRKDRYSLRGTQLIALLFAAYVNLRLVFVSGKFRKVERDGGDVNVATFMFSHIALVYQGALVLQLFSPLSLMFTLGSELDRNDINNALYSKDMAIVAPIGVLAVLSLLDIFISSINFRLTYVFPIVVYGMMFMFFSIFRFGSARRPYYVGMSACGLIGIAFVTLLLSRATNLTLYEKHRAQTTQPLQTVISDGVSDGALVGDSDAIPVSPDVVEGSVGAGADDQACLEHGARERQIVDDVDEIF